MLRNLLSTLLALMLLAPMAYAQTGQGGLKGKVIDVETGEPLPFVNIVVEKNGVQVNGSTTDFDGKYFIKPLEPGVYTIKTTFTGYAPNQINGVKVTAEKIGFVDVKMNSTVEELNEFVVTEYKVPLISKDNTTSGSTVTKEDLVRMPGRSANAIAQTVGGVYSADDGSGNLNIRGSRSDANYYYIDGIKVRGSSSVPQSSIEEISVITGGLPAQYGDVTGGVISITTRGPSRNYSGNMEYVTSGFKIGDKVRGLDKFGYNLFEASLTGPLVMKKDAEGKKTEPLVGFFLAGNLTSQIDNRGLATGSYQVKDEVLNRINQDPLRYNRETGTLKNSDFLRLNSFEKQATRQDAESLSFNGSAKLDINTGKTTNLTLGGTIAYTKRRIWEYRNMLFNSNNNPERTSLTWRAFARFTQRFGSSNQTQEQKSASLIKNAFYTVQMDFNQNSNRQWDKELKDDYFKYGYVGQFKSYKERSYAYRQNAEVVINNGQDTLIMDAKVQTVFSDTLIGFRPGDINPELTRYTTNYYNIFGWKGYDENGNPVFDDALATYGPDGRTQDNLGNSNNFFLSRVNNITQRGGRTNGMQPDQIYQLWNSPGTRTNQIYKRLSNQFRVSAMGSADIKDHNISLGFEFEQRVNRGFNANIYRNDNVNLWSAATQRANSHIPNLDFSNASIYRDEVIPTINYERLNSSPGAYRGDAYVANTDSGEAEENQSFFDLNVRKALGLNPDGTDFIDIQALDPDFLKLEMFSANELLNNGSEYVSYYGYDPYGNLTSNNTTLNDFFTATDENNNYTRPIGAFRPNYIAGWIQDKFSFDDLVFNVGLRVDRYDANQEVLIDKYVLFPTIKAGEITSDSRLTQLQEWVSNNPIPGNIGNDYVVYVNDVENPSEIKGYRSGDQWYNRDGIQIEDPRAIYSNGGIKPLLLNFDDKNKITPSNLTSESFKDYDPQINLMPRISFSFPISEDANFFAHYDVLTKRPTATTDFRGWNDATRLNPLDYLFIEQRGQNRIANPDLKPEQTIDYALGFQQKVTNSSSIKIEAFYREFRDQVQVVGVIGAYPRNYTTFGNIDFGTVKGATFTYDFRKSGNLSFKASYTLQFAEGTGSSNLGAANLVRAGKQNIRAIVPFSYDRRHNIVGTVDYRYGKGKDYNGPLIAGKQILANTGVNFQLNVGSGTPYSRQSNITGTQLPGGLSPLLKGTIHGSRLPWQSRIDMRLDRDIQLNVGKKERPINMTVYLTVQNLLNSLVERSIYRATGSATDDGYLTAPEFQNDIQNQNDEQAFREYYTMSVNDPRNFNLPRRMRLGVMLNF